jgi:hypothetical protein
MQGCSCIELGEDCRVDALGEDCRGDALGEDLQSGPLARMKCIKATASQSHRCCGFLICYVLLASTLLPAQAHTHTHTYTHAYSRTNTHTHTHTRIHKHTYTRKLEATALLIASCVLCVCPIFSALLLCVFEHARRSALLCVFCPDVSSVLFLCCVFSILLQVNSAASTGSYSIANGPHPTAASLDSLYEGNRGHY